MTIDHSIYGNVPAPEDPRIQRVVGAVREYLRDHPHLNRLTAGHDHNDRHIYWAMLDTLSDWSVTPPFIGQDFDLILRRGWFALLKDGIVIRLLTSLGLLHTRNFLSYSDGGVNVQTENPQLLQAWLQMFKNEYEQKKTRALIALNIENAISEGGGVHSDYIYASAWFGAW